MIDEQKINKAIPRALKTADLPNLGKKIQGKVRDIYIKGNKRIIITTDRQSAFDQVLGLVPYKGAVLNLLSAWWFAKTKDIVANHILEVPDPNVSVVKNCQPIPVEMVVRGYMTGSTKTSIWTSYEKGEREIYGIKFPDGLRKNDKLPQAVITPTTHAEIGQHDERLTRDTIVSKGLVEERLYAKMEKATLELFNYSTKTAKARGLIFVDTKYEFGLYNGELTLMDELNTPDSSRFWLADSYEEKHVKGEEPESLSKEFLRLWYKDQGYTGDGKAPPMPDDITTRLAKLYIEAYEMLTSERFDFFNYPIEERIISALQVPPDRWDTGQQKIDLS